MEEKKAQISAYLRTTVSPFITPLMEEIVKKRPSDLLEFAKAYINNQIDKRKKAQPHTDSEESQQDHQEVDKKFQQKMKQKKKQKKISRQGISAEAYGLFNKKQDFVPKVIQKPSSTKQSIRQLLKRSVLFGALGDEDMNIVIDAMSIEQIGFGQNVIKQGDEGLILYVVGSGEFDCTKVISGKQTYLKTYKTGEYFGELALMYTAPRAASIKCKTPGVLYGLDRLTFKHIIQEAANKRREKFTNFFSKVQILSEIDPYQKQQLCDILREQTFNEGDYVIKQGEEGSKFYMVVEGKLIAEQESKTVFKYEQGDYFGQIALIRNCTRKASIKCQTPVRLVYIQRDAFKRMFGPIEEILKKNEEKYKKYMEK